MQLCVGNPFCQHFGFWPDGGCMLQGGDAKLVKAACDASQPDCPGERVVTGPRDLADETLWPRLAAPTADREVDVVEVVEDVPTATSSPFPGRLVLGALGLAALGAVFFASRKGLCEAEDDEDEQSGEDEEVDGLAKPLAGGASGP